jgi:NTP pyrophosphatase (non-canonical NTP hydrolase)
MQEELGLAISDVQSTIDRQPYVNQLTLPQRQLIGLLGLVEEANEVAEVLFNNLDIFATQDEGYSTSERLQTLLELSITTGKELGVFKKRLLSESLHINVVNRYTYRQYQDNVQEGCFNVLYYWLLITDTNSIDLVTLLKTGLSKVKRRDPNVR